MNRQPNCTTGIYLELKNEFHVTEEELTTVVGSNVQMSARVDFGALSGRIKSDGKEWFHLNGFGNLKPGTGVTGTLERVLE